MAQKLGISPIILAEYEKNNDRGDEMVYSNTTLAHWTNDGRPSDFLILQIRHLPNSAICEPWFANSQSAKRLIPSSPLARPFVRDNHTYQLDFCLLLCQKLDPGEFPHFTPAEIG